MNCQQNFFNGSPIRKNKYTKEYEHSPQKFSNYDIIHSPKSKGFPLASGEIPSLAQDPKNKYSTNNTNMMEYKEMQPSQYQHYADNHHSYNQISNAGSPFMRTPLIFLRRNSEELSQNITIERQLFHSDLDSPLCHLRINSNRNLKIEQSSMILNNSLPSSLAEMDYQRQTLNFKGERSCSDSFQRQRIDNQDNVFERYRTIGRDNIITNVKNCFCQKRLYKRANRSPLKYPGSVRNSKYETKQMDLGSSSVNKSRERKNKKQNFSQKISSPTNFNQRFKRARSSIQKEGVFQWKNDNSTSSTQETSLHCYQNPEKMLAEQEKYQNGQNFMDSFTNLKDQDQYSRRKQTHDETQQITTPELEVPNHNTISTMSNNNIVQIKSKQTKAQLALKVVRIEQEQKELKLKQNVLEQYKLLLRHRLQREEQEEEGDKDEVEIPYAKQFFRSQNNISENNEKEDNEEIIFSNTCLKKHKQSTIKQAGFQNQHKELSKVRGISQKIESQQDQIFQPQKNIKVKSTNTKHKKVMKDISYSENQNEMLKEYRNLKTDRTEGKIEKVSDILTKEKHNQGNKNSSLINKETKYKTEISQDNSKEEIFKEILHVHTSSQNQDNHTEQAKNKIKNILNLALQKIHESSPSKVKVVPLKYISPNISNNKSSKQFHMEKNQNSQCIIVPTPPATINGGKSNSQHQNLTSRLSTKEITNNKSISNDKHKNSDNSPTQRGLHQAREEFLKRCGKIKKNNTQESNHQEHTESQPKGGCEKQELFKNSPGYAQQNILTTQDQNSNNQTLSNNFSENKAELCDSIATPRINNNSRHQESFQGIFQKTLNQDDNNKQQEGQYNQQPATQSRTLNRRDSFGVVIISEEEFRKRKELQEPDYGYGLKWQHSAEFMKWQERQSQKESTQEESTIDALNIVHRQQKWLRERDDKLLQLKQENIRKELDLCTFKPNFIGNSPKKQSKQNMSPQKMNQQASNVATVPLTYIAIQQMKNLRKNNILHMNNHKVA